MQAESKVAERVLITGAGGVLGTALVRELSGSSDLVALRRADCDLLDRDATVALWRDIRPTIVYHLAGWVAGVQGNLNNAGRAFYENAQININVIEASRLCGAAKIVAAGTTAIYSDEVALPMREDDVWVGSPHGSEKAYGHAKRAMLAQLEAYADQYGIDFCYMVCTNLYGPNDRFDEAFGHVVPSLISRFEQATREAREEITIWGDGSPTRDFVFASDAARAFALAGERGHGTYNLATGHSVTIRDLVDALIEVFRFEGRVVWDTSKPSGQRKRSYDVGKLRALGWSPATTLSAGLAETSDWYRSRRDSVRR